MTAIRPGDALTAEKQEALDKAIVPSTLAGRIRKVLRESKCPMTPLQLSRDLNVTITKVHQSVHNMNHRARKLGRPEPIVKVGQYKGTRYILADEVKVTNDDSIKQRTAKYKEIKLWLYSTPTRIATVEQIAEGVKLDVSEVRSLLKEASRNDLIKQRDANTYILTEAGVRWSRGQMDTGNIQTDLAPIRAPLAVKKEESSPPMPQVLLGEFVKFLAGNEAIIRDDRGEYWLAYPLKKTETVIMPNGTFLEI